MTTNHAQVSIGGDVTGSQIAVGNHNIQVGEHGVLINIVAASAQPAFTRRPAPVDLRPRRYTTLLDRVAEINTAITSWASIPVILRGAAGAGKTFLLRELANLPETREFLDGVVFLSVRDVPLDDLRQKLFECFYQGNTNSKAEEPQILHSLHDIKALILLDDITLSEDDTSALLDTAPNCAFILVSTGQVLLGRSQTLTLGGLPEEDALTLFERELGRSLSEDDKSAAHEICKLLDHHPLNILQAASMAREDRKSLEALRTQLTIKEHEDFLLHGSIESLPETQKKILSVLTAASGAPVHQMHLAALSGTSSAQPALDDLKARGLIQDDDPHYSLVGSLGLNLARAWGNMDAWEDSIIDYLAGWLTQNPKDELIEQAQDILIVMIKKAGRKNRWHAVISLGRGLERVLILWRRWQSWVEILNLILKAARALRDRKMEAYAYHQLGSRALSLNITDQAEQFLTQAMSIRKAIGDKAGLAFTRHNLELMGGKPPSIKMEGSNEGGQFNTARRTLNWRAVIGSTMLLTIGIVSGSLLFPREVRVPDTVPVPQTVIVPQTVVALQTVVVTQAVTLPPADKTAPPAPRILGPFNTPNNPFYCTDNINLTWSPVRDQGPPVLYQVRIFAFRYSLNEVIHPFDLDQTNGTSQNINSTLDDLCTVLFSNEYVRIFWTIHAQDSAGNKGDYSYSEFLIRKEVIID